jgi:hypothetical protein
MQGKISANLRKNAKKLNAQGPTPSYQALSIEHSAAGILVRS